jgi:hypothetical protein
MNRSLSPCRDLVARLSGLASGLPAPKGPPPDDRHRAAPPTQDGQQGHAPAPSARHKARAYRSYVIRVKSPGHRRQQAALGGRLPPPKKRPRPPATRAGSRPAAVSTSTATGSPWPPTSMTGSNHTRWRSSRGPCRTTGPACGCTSRRASAACKSRPFGRLPPPISTATC